MKKLVLVLIASLVASGAFAQATATPASERMGEIVVEASQEGWMQINVEDAADYIFQVEPYILDVRTVDEFDDGYIEFAVNIPVVELPENLEQLPADLDTPILVYCAAGTRGQWGIAYLTSLGYTNVKNMSGGFRAWTEAGYPSVN